jgi:phospholipid/cholesterol/gamma-HCH transport system permease protein
MRKFVEGVGAYALLMIQVFRRPGPFRLFHRRVIYEISLAGLNSLTLILIISLFMGAVISIQLAANIESPLIPKYTVGYASRQSIIYEFSTTVVALILAGKVGSQMASELGSMRISEQIDALEIMGINSAAFLILPKIIGFVIIHPFLVLISMVVAVFGSYAAVVYTGMIAHEDFVMGLELDFKSFDVVYALVKTVVFAYLIASVSSYKGYFVRGGASDVGHASTEAVVASIFAILTSNLIITFLMLL